MNTQLPTRHRPSMMQDAIGGLNVGRGPHVSLAGNRFTLVDASGNEKPVQTLYLDVVVIDVNKAVSRIYYDPMKPWTPGDSSPPLCFSDNGIGASAQAQTPLNSNCQLCDKSAWGSAVSKLTGKGVPACQQRKKLAVLVGGMGEIVFNFTVPPASLGHWLDYCKLAAQRGIEPYDVFTRIEFVQGQQGILQFTPAPIGDKGTCFIPADSPLIPLTEKLWQTGATVDATGKNDVVWGGQADAAKIAYAQSQPVAQIAPAAQPMAPPPQPFGGARDPFIAPQLGVATFGQPTSTLVPAAATPSVTDPFGQPGVSSPTAATPEAPKRTRGPNKPKEQPPAADDGVPPFLRRDANNQPPVPPAPNPTQFGMQANAPAPDAGVQAALDAAFRLPT